MNPNELQFRQRRLLTRSTELRMQLRSNLHSLQRPAARADQVTAGMLWLYQHPQWPAGALALLLVLKPKRALIWAGKLWWLWKSARVLRHWRAILLAYLS